jgi:hypothetical protein
MKQLFSHLAAAAILVVCAFMPVYATPVVPEPTTMGILGAVAVGSLLAKKILRRK